MNNEFDIPEKTLKEWDRQYRRDFNRRNNIEDPFYTETGDNNNEIRISGVREAELDAFYDPASPRNSLAEQSKVYERNPEVDAFMRRKWNLHPTMVYSGKY
jgi:hypothetical protein